MPLEARKRDVNLLAGEVGRIRHRELACVVDDECPRPKTLQQFKIAREISRIGDGAPLTLADGLETTGHTSRGEAEQQRHAEYGEARKTVAFELALPPSYSHIMDSTAKCRV